MPPVYPYDKLAELAGLAQRHEGGAVDLSIGTPCDPPPARVLEALAGSGTERGYPSSIGLGGVPRGRTWRGSRAGSGSTPPLWPSRRASGPRSSLPGVPHWLRLRTPGRDTVLCPLLAYPTYEMGAILARCRAVAVPTRPDGTHGAVVDLAGGRVAGTVPVGQQPRKPRGSARGPGGGGELGTLTRRTGVLRRVLRGVHLGRARPHDPRARPRGRCRGPLAVETVEPRGAAGRVLRRRRRPCRVPVAPAPACRVHGSRARAARRLR